MDQKKFFVKPVVYIVERDKLVLSVFVTEHLGIGSGQDFFG